MEKKLVVLILLIIGCPLVCWASQGGFRICFKETERSSQCQGPSHTCSGWSNSPAWSESFRDDTDNRAGGCQYQWRIEAQGTINPEMEYRLCFKETEGSSQCQGTRSSCTGWTPSPSWTDRFRDDTDNRGGGCRYAWKIESRCPKPRESIQVCRVCFKEVEGSSQCQGNRQSCSGWSAPGSTNPSWTLPFRDDTDNRGGGCTYQWFLDCTSLKTYFFCQRDSPCDWNPTRNNFLFADTCKGLCDWYFFVPVWKANGKIYLFEMPV